MDAALEPEGVRGATARGTQLRPELLNLYKQKIADYASRCPRACELVERSRARQNLRVF